MKCLLPWVHVYHHSDGAIYPCCKLAGNKKFLLGTTDQKLDEVWNTSKLREMRRGVIDGCMPRECVEHCFSGAQPFHFYFSNQYYDQQQLMFDQTSPSGYFASPPRVFMIVNSNICNLKCLYCSEHYSNLIYIEKHGINKIYKTFDDPSDATNLIRDNIDNIDCIVFAAGESAIQDNYYDIMDLLYSSGKADINIQFITNLTTLKYKDYDVVKCLKRFKNATIIGSVDAVGRRQEFIRRNSRFEQIEANLNRVVSEGIKFVLQPVITNLNVSSLPDLHYMWFEKNLLRKDNIRYITLTTPEIFRVNNLPDYVKDIAISKLEKYCDFLKAETSTDLNNCKPFDKIKSIIRCMQERNTKYTDLLFHLSEKTTMADFYEIFPEFNYNTP